MLARLRLFPVDRAILWRATVSGTGGAPIVLFRLREPGAPGELCCEVRPLSGDRYRIGFVFDGRPLTRPRAGGAILAGVVRADADWLSHVERLREALIRLDGWQDVSHEPEGW